MEFIVKRRLYPKYVTGFIDTRGVERTQFRKRGHSRYYFKGKFGTEEFRRELRACLDQISPPTVVKKTVIFRSIDELLNLYYQSSAFKGNAAENTLSKRRAVLEGFRAKTGSHRVALANYQGLDKIIAQEAVKKPDGRGGPFAAQTLKKQLTRLFKFATKIGWIKENPMLHVEYKAPSTKGFRSWTESDIEKYQKRWRLGTKQRLALELMLWTGKRKSDAVTLSRDDLLNGKLVGRDIKTGKEWELPIAPQLKEAIEALEAYEPHEHPCYLVSERGGPYTAASFGNMFREWCDAAGLPECSAHGLRKAIMRRMAELGMGNSGIKSISLHTNDAEVSHYVAAANQSSMAENAIGQLSEWEVSHRQKMQMSHEEISK